MELIDRISAERLRRFGFWGFRVPGPLGAHHYYDGPGQGDLPTLVLLHGFSSRATHLVKLVNHLRPHFRRIVLPDLLGHGQSDDPPPGATNRDVTAAFFDVLHHLIDEPALVFGNSLGGMMGLRYASWHPGQVRGLLVTSPGGAPLPPEQHAEFISRFRPRTIAEARQLVDLAFATSPKLARIAAMSIHKRMSAASVQRLLNQMTTEDFLTPGELQSIQAPLTFLWGQAERVLLDDHLAFFEAHLPAHTTIDRPPDYGHVPYFENSEDLGRRIVEFARGVSGLAAA